MDDNIKFAGKVDSYDDYDGEEIGEQFPEDSITNANDFSGIINKRRIGKEDRKRQNEELEHYRQEQMRQDLSDPSILQSAEMREENVANFLQQINPDNELENLEHRLRGDRKDNFTKQWIPNKNCSINESLVQNYVSFLGSIINQNTSLSNLSTAQINKLMKLCIAWIVDDMDINCKKYGLKGQPSEMTRIGIIILSLTFLTLNQALNGNRGRMILGRVSLSGTLENQKQKSNNPFKFWN